LNFMSIFKSPFWEPSLVTKHVSDIKFKGSVHDGERISESGHLGSIFH
jgi:hypothetical protein